MNDYSVLFDWTDSVSLAILHFIMTEIGLISVEQRKSNPIPDLDATQRTMP